MAQKEEEVFDLRHALTTGVRKVKGEERGIYFHVEGNWRGEVRTASEWARSLPEAKEKIATMISRRRAALKREEEKLARIEKNAASDVLPMKKGD